jgi:hypothetical protein
MAPLVVQLAHFTQTNFFKRAMETGTLQLLTISFSHYAEMSRWCLQLSGIPFKEYGYVPIQHVLPVLSARVDRDGVRTYISDSSIVEPVVPDPSKDPKSNSGRFTAVPFAVLPYTINGKSTLDDSWAICDYTGLAKIQDSTKKILDEEIGPLTRQFAYTFVLKASNENVWNGLCTANRSWLWRLIWRIGLGNLILKIMRGFFLSDDPAIFTKCRANLATAVAKVDSIISKRVTKYIDGDVPGITDIAVASLMAPALNYPQYCGGEYADWFCMLEHQDAAFAQELNVWRNTVTGKYAKEIYESFRSERNLFNKKEL